MGPLAGIKVIEMKGLGPGPYAGMLLADMGAEVIVVERSSKAQGIAPLPEKDCNSRGKKSIALNLKSAEGIEALMKLVETADVLFEGFRPGVAERLGFGPEVCAERNPKLVYGRITGWGQTGPLSHAAGHDINYISITGVLAAIGRKDRPEAPLNLAGDYAGGSLFLVIGILAALLEAQQSGQGQVIDAAITDGSASIMSLFHTMHELGQWKNERYANMLDGGAPYYDSYETADGKFVSIGSIEPQFYALLMEKAQLDPAIFAKQHDQENWDEMKGQMQAVFKTKTRDEWCAIMDGTDVCFAPVLDFEEAPKHPHNIARGTYVEVNGYTQPGPAPKFSRTELVKPKDATPAGSDTVEVLKSHGFSDADLDKMRDAGVLT